MMHARIYKEVFFDASHRLLHYKGKCARIHGHRWKVEVWIEGETDSTTCILVDYNTIKDVLLRYDHQVILNEADPMVPCIRQFQDVITTPGDPTSELLAGEMRELINQACAMQQNPARVSRIRVWESGTCYAEIGDPGQ